MKKHLTVSNISGVILIVTIIISMLISKHSLWVIKKQITTYFSFFQKKKDTPPNFFIDKNCTETTYDPILGTTTITQWEKGEKKSITKYDKTDKLISKEFRYEKKQVEEKHLPSSKQERLKQAN